MKLKPSLRSMLAVVLLAAGAYSSEATMVVWKSKPENDWDWTNPNNFDDGAVPKAGDMIVVPAGCVVYVRSTDTASCNLVCDAATYVQMRNAGAAVVFDVGEGEDLACQGSVSSAWGGYESTFETGSLRKVGKGKLTIQSSGTGLRYYTSFRVEEGELVLDIGKSQSVGVLSVAKSAKILIKGVSVSLSGFEGEGTIDRETPCQDYLVGSGTYAFGGTLGDNMRPWVDAGLQLWTGDSSTFTNKLQVRYGAKVGSCVGIGTFGTAGEQSSAGRDERIVLGDGSGGVVYLGSGETTTKKLELDITPNGPSWIDGGPNGGLVWNGNLLFNSWRDQYVSFAFTGTNAAPCTFGGKIQDLLYHNLAVYVIKDGTGTWTFTGNKDGTACYGIGGIAVRNGVLQFDSIAEKGTDCALGSARLMSDGYVGGRSNIDSHKVDYAYVLGGSNAGVANETALLEYVGTTAATVTTRPAVLNGRGGFKSSSAAFDFTGVTAKGEETDDVLLLDGDGAITNVIRNVADGSGKVGIEKNGSGTWILKGTNTFSGPVTVNAGTFVLASSRKPYSWYRFNIKSISGSATGTGGGQAVSLSYLGFYDKDGYAVSDGITNAVSSDPGSATAAANLLPGQAAFAPRQFHFSTTPSDTVIGGELYQAFLFNSNVMGGYFHKNQYWNIDTPDPNDEETWGRIVLRLPTGVSPVTSYDFVRVATGDWRAKYQIMTWSLDASVDGKSWNEVDETKTKPLIESTWGNHWANVDTATYVDFTDPVHKTGKAIASHVTIGALPTTHEWSVADGATLVNEDEGLPLTVSKLTVDATKGVGAFVNFTFAETGVLDISNLAFEKGEYVRTFTGDFSQASGFAEHVPNWTVTVNGAAPKKCAVTVSGSTITVTKNVGTLIILR